ncbi:NUDIX domain-containing protein [Frankia sp. AgB32]|uniref:NUDIX domain-containing protein n=1 Tax=Frankia sp. AgB32 TaxID=631119 RepID=UPI00200D3357|nr:NUDIX domain-containing protein [Frankia sp. AgB32]MCK9893678.1 NUDIX domain-containing protein [Frankia sp. AgB32]
MSAEHRTLVDVLMLVLRHDQLLLTMRAGEVYGSGWWALPSGRLEAGEDVVAAAVRELDEELGIAVDDDDVTFVGVTHALPPGRPARIGFGFALTRWHGEPSIREPDRCSALTWCSPDDLPARTLPYTREIVRLYHAGVAFSRFGWREPVADASVDGSPPGHPA